MRSLRVATAADLLVVAALVGSGQLTAWTADAGGWQGGRAVHAVLLGAATAPLLVRERRPLAVVLMVTTAGWLQYRLGGGAFQPWFAQLLALYAVGARAPLRQAVAGAAATAVSLLSIDLPRLAAGDPVDEVLPAWAVVAGAWGFGRWMRRRRRETTELVTRAAAAEHRREQEAARAVAEERARIARELHDLVAHSMGVIVIQAQAAQRSLDSDRDAAAGALRAIETVGRQGLGELRRLLDLLTGTTETSLSPQPSLAGLPELVAQIRSTGLPVELDISGDLTSLPAGVDLAAYRIVQEALTNVLKHARATTARVAVRRVGATVDIEVRDDGAGAPGPAAGTGRGLVGMRERVALYGGLVDAGSVDGGGFRVQARLPVGGGPA